jgi:hypothetical protein
VRASLSFDECRGPARSFLIIEQQAWMVRSGHEHNARGQPLSVAHAARKYMLNEELPRNRAERFLETQERCLDEIRRIIYLVG